MTYSLKKINSYNKLIVDIEILRNRVYSHDSKSDMTMLLELWTGLKDTDEIKSDSIITKKWQDIGFQGSDPATDFRGKFLTLFKIIKYLVIIRKQVWECSGFLI